jgi:hypothetical protein
MPRFVVLVPMSKMINCAESSSDAAEDTDDSVLQGMIKFFLSVFITVAHPHLDWICLQVDPWARFGIRIRLQEDKRSPPPPPQKKNQQHNFMFCLAGCSEEI